MVDELLDEEHSQLEEQALRDWQDEVSRIMTK